MHNAQFCYSKENSQQSSAGNNIHCSFGNLGSCGYSPGLTFDFVVAVNNIGSLAGRILPVNHDERDLHFKLKLCQWLFYFLLRNTDLKIVGNWELPKSWSRGERFLPKCILFAAVRVCRRVYSEKYHAGEEEIMRWHYTAFSFSTYLQFYNFCK